MRTNRAYTAGIVSGMGNVTMQMQSALKPANRKPLPISTQEMTEYVECLLDIGEECSLNPEEACRLIDLETNVYDSTTTSEGN